MITFTSLLREFIKLFVDDGSLALAIVAVVAAAAIMVKLVPDVPLAAGAVLLFGCLGVLLANTVRAGVDFIARGYRPLPQSTILK
jgi:hypothetical protein